MLGRAIRTLSRGMSLVIGRERTVLLARCLDDAGRLDGQNHPRVNGERELIHAVVRRANAAAGLTVFDVGANVGWWTRELARAVAARADLDPRSVRVVAFEPADASYRALQERAAQLPIAVRAERMALSAKAGRRTLHIVGDTAGVNSLYPPYGLRVEGTEDVEVSTLDEYTAAAGIDRVDFVKIDAEGEDLAVMEGARGLLAAGRIGLIQFEYNHHWIPPHRLLKDAFDLLQPWGFTLGKLTRYGWEPYRRWHPELERYRESNFLAVSPAWWGILPSIEWWGRRLYGM